MLKGLQIYISGRVQNVGFRYSAFEMAKKLEITGFVCNLSNGNVLLEIFGEEGRIDQMLLWCYQGNSVSFIEKVEFSEIPFQKCVKFEIKPTRK